MASQPPVDSKVNIKDQQHKPEMNCIENESEIKSTELKEQLSLEPLSEDFKTETKQIYEEQCPSLSFSDYEQEALLQLLSLERSNNYPLLIYLINGYFRDRFEYHKKQISQSNEKKELDIAAWANGKNRTVRNLLQLEYFRNMKENEFRNIIISGMQTYMRRYWNELRFPPQNLIRDQLRVFIDCIQEAISLIQYLFDNAHPPFQVIYT